MYYYVSINNMSNFMLTITDSVSKSAEGPICYTQYLKRLLYIVSFHFNKTHWRELYIIFHVWGANFDLFPNFFPLFPPFL